MPQPAYYVDYSKHAANRNTKGIKNRRTVEQPALPNVRGVPNSGRMVLQLASCKLERQVLN